MDKVQLSGHAEIGYTLFTMSRLTKIALTDEQRAALKKGYKFGGVHGFRQRCQMILLKEKQLTSKQIGEQLGCCLVTVNHWLKRYQAEGIEGLHIREGRGRRAILHKETDLPAVRRAVQANRQRLRLAQEALQTELGKQFSPSTLKRFLKKTVADSSEYEGA
jgi:transposase